MDGAQKPFVSACSLTERPSPQGESMGDPIAIDAGERMYKTMITHLPTESELDPQPIRPNTLATVLTCSAVEQGGDNIWNISAWPPKADGWSTAFCTGACVRVGAGGGLEHATLPVTPAPSPHPHRPSQEAVRPPRSHRTLLADPPPLFLLAQVDGKHAGQRLCMPHRGG